MGHQTSQGVGTNELTRNLAIRNPTLSLHEFPRVFWNGTQPFALPFILTLKSPWGVLDYTKDLLEKSVDISPHDKGLIAIDFTTSLQILCHETTIKQKNTDQTRRNAPNNHILLDLLLTETVWKPPKFWKHPFINLVSSQDAAQQCSQVWLIQQSASDQMSKWWIMKNWVVNCWTIKKGGKRQESWRTTTLQYTKEIWTLGDRSWLDNSFGIYRFLETLLFYQVFSPIFRAGRWIPRLKQSFSEVD